MQIREIPIDGNMAASFSRQSQPNRIENVMHVSEVIRWVDHKTFHRGKRPPTSELSQAGLAQMALRTSIGFAWEALIRTALRDVWCTNNPENSPHRFVSPGQLEKDGIYCSPDWLDIRDKAVEEFKATWRSSRHDIETDFWSWMVQVKAYCYVLEVNVVRLRTFFVNGNYKDGPEIKMWEITFSARELADNWIMILNNARAMEKESRENGNATTKQWQTAI